MQAKEHNKSILVPRCCLSQSLDRSGAEAGAVCLGLHARELSAVQVLLFFRDELFSNAVAPSGNPHHPRALGPPSSRLPRTQPAPAAMITRLLEALVLALSFLFVLNPLQPCAALLIPSSLTPLIATLSDTASLHSASSQAPFQRYIEALNVVASLDSLYDYKSGRLGPSSRSIDDDDLPIAAAVVHPSLGLLSLEVNRVQLGGFLTTTTTTTTTASTDALYSPPQTVASPPPNPLLHAELLALTSSQRLLHSSYLQGCTLVVTTEPCFLCVSAALSLRLRRIVYPVVTGGGGVAATADGGGTGKPAGKGSRKGGLGGCVDLSKGVLKGQNGLELLVAANPLWRDVEVIRVEGVKGGGGGLVQGFFKWKRARVKEIEEEEKKVATRAGRVEQVSAEALLPTAPIPSYLLNKRP